MATPQLGGASSYFSNIAHPGVHVKSWRGSPKKVVTNDNNDITNNNSRTIGEELGSSVDTPSSLSSSSSLLSMTTSAVTGYSPSSTGNHSDHRRGIHSRVRTTTATSDAVATSNTSTINNVTGMNDITQLLGDTNNASSTNTLPNSNDTVPHPTMVGSNVTGRLNPVLKMGWLPGMRQSTSAKDIGLASLLDDDKVD